MHQIGFWWSFAPDPTGETYSAPPDPLAVWGRGKGEIGKGKEKRRGRGRKREWYVEERKERREEGRGGEEEKEGEGREKGRNECCLKLFRCPGMQQPKLTAAVEAA